jgi:hypothetical protein
MNLLENFIRKPMYLWLNNSIITEVKFIFIQKNFNKEKIQYRYYKIIQILHLIEFKKTRYHLKIEHTGMFQMTKAKKTLRVTCLVLFSWHFIACSLSFFINEKNEERMKARKIVCGFSHLLLRIKIEKRKRSEANFSTTHRLT